MQEVQPIRNIKADFIQVINPGVFLPGEIIISVSDDGENFTELKRQQNASNPASVCFEAYEWQGETTARYVRYQARSDKKLGGWIFTDEIIVN